MASREEIKIRIEFHRSAVEKLRAAYLALIDGGVQSYTIGSRSLTRFDLEKIAAAITAHEKEIDGLETVLQGGKRRKAYGVVPRDW